MNQVYALIRNRIVTVGLLAGLLTSGQAIAAPTGGQISAGQGSIGQSGATTTITQGSQRLAINWQDFNVGTNETVNFIQPGRNAIALNRVLGADGTRILGNINSNGQVFILNPNGVLFGANAQVNVGGLIASTLNLSDADFMAGNHVFNKTGGNGAVVNQGQLVAEDGGYIALIGPRVRNEGFISARLGTALLAAGDKVTLNLNNGSLVGYSIDQGSLDALAENTQLIRADGGQVLMSAAAANALTRAVVNNTGVIEARTLQNIEGRIMLMGDMEVGQVNVGGTLDASAPNGGNGGFIETSAAHVRIADGVRITTAAPQGAAGAWLIDPVDFTIAASGGDITGAALSIALGSSNVVIQSTNGAAGTAGDINVNDTVSWNNNNLALLALHNINVNADLNASGSASLALEWGQVSAQAGNNSELIIKNAAINLPAGTGNFTTRFGTDGITKNYTVITSLGAAGSATGTDLQGIVADPTLNYALGANIDASATAGWNAGAGFDPINNFSGTLDGLGHSITNLNINRPGQDYVGLFGYTMGASLLNLNLVNAQVTGRHQTGALVGGTTLGTVNRVNVSGQVNGADSVGGLIGYDNTTSVGNSSSSVDVSGDNYIGGLLGSTGGGVATGANYATGSVTGTGNFVGGLVGFNGFAFVITDSYATGPVNGSGFVGGLVGYHWNGGIVNSYSTGSVTGNTDVGGLVGFDAGGGIILDSFWNTQTSGQATSVGGTGLTTAQMQSQASYTGLDFANNWVIYEGHTTPLLRSFLTPITVTANNVTKVDDGLPYSGGNGVTYSSTPNGNLLGTVNFSGTSQGATNVGTYVITPGDLYSNQLGYLITFVDGALNVTTPVTPSAPPLNVAGYAGALQSLWHVDDVAQSGDANTSNTNLITTLNCGVRMPEGFAADACLQ